MGRNGWAIVGIAAAIVVSYVAWTWFLSPEARVKNVIHSAAAAAEEVDTETFLSYFASDYSDYLHGERSVFAERVEEAFSRVDRLNVTVQSADVSVDGEDAAVRFELVVVAFRGDDRFVAVGTPFQPEVVSATLTHDGSSWKFVRVDRAIAE